MREYETHSDYRGLLANVIANPNDDLPRLVLADKVEEAGDDRRARFIRLQCELAREPCRAKFMSCEEAGHPCDCPHPLRQEIGYLYEHYWTPRVGPPWTRPGTFRADFDTQAVVPSIRFDTAQHIVNWTDPEYARRVSRSYSTDNRLRPILGQVLWRRGFIAEARMPLRVLLSTGSSCSDCRGTGTIRGIKNTQREYRIDFGNAKPPDFEYVNRQCEACYGLGSFGGYWWPLFRNHPIEQVVLIDQRPYSGYVGRGTAGPYCWINPEATVQGDMVDAVVPRIVYDRLKGGHVLAFYRQYDSRDAALRAMSDCLVSLFRGSADFQLTREAGVLG